MYSIVVLSSQDVRGNHVWDRSYHRNYNMVVQGKRCGVDSKVGLVDFMVYTEYVNNIRSIKQIIYFIKCIIAYVFIDPMNQSKKINAHVVVLKKR
jgi:hypothetical protein